MLPQNDRQSFPATMIIECLQFAQLPFVSSIVVNLRWAYKLWTRGTKLKVWINTADHRLADAHAINCLPHSVPQHRRCNDDLVVVKTRCRSRRKNQPPTCQREVRPATAYNVKIPKGGSTRVGKSHIDVLISVWKQYRRVGGGYKRQRSSGRSAPVCKKDEEGRCRTRQNETESLTVMMADIWSGTWADSTVQPTWPENQMWML